MRDSVRTFSLPVRPPYRLDLTATVLRRLSTNVVDVFDGVTYRRMIGDPAFAALVEVRQTSETALLVRLIGDPPVDVAHLLSRMLGTAVELDQFYAAADGFPWLAQLARAARGMKAPRYPSLWEAVVNAVIFQQISIHAAAAILRRVIEYLEPLRTFDTFALAPFPSAQAWVDADPSALRALGLSSNKILALRTLGRAILDGQLDAMQLEPYATPQLVAQLSTFHGIGPWTAAVIALRGFGRLDIFPMKDSGVARSLKELACDPAFDPAALLVALGPQRGMLYYHLLVGRLAARGEIVLAPK